MIRKLKQIWNDHKAMQILREHRGDVHLISVVGGSYGEGYECRIYQHDWVITHQDPAEAILLAYRTWKRGDEGWPCHSYDRPYGDDDDRQQLRDWSKRLLDGCGARVADLFTEREFDKMEKIVKEAK